jgi:AraC-like DNA-binding protein
MEYQITSPSRFLSPYVKHYWTLENCVQQGQKHIQRIVPNGLTELIIYFGNRPRSSESGRSFNENSILSGQLNTFYDLEITGNMSLFSIIFQPHGLSTFFGIPANELMNQNVPLKFLLKDKIDELENKLFEAGTFVEKVRFAEIFLYDCLKKKSSDYHFNRINNSIFLINKNKGSIGIDKLAEASCFSRKQFERTFSMLVGISPKQFLKTVRFQNAIHEKSKNKTMTLSELTYLSGYFDQSHMNNDFYRLSGFTPKQYFAECDPYSDYFG